MTTKKPVNPGLPSSKEKTKFRIHVQMICDHLSLAHLEFHEGKLPQASHTLDLAEASIAKLRSDIAKLQQ